MPEAARLQQGGRDNVTQREKRHCRRDDEVRDPPQAAVEPQAQHVGAVRVGTYSGHRRQLGGGNRHPKQADRKRVKHLCIGQSRHRPGRQQTGQERIDVSAYLDDAAAEERRHEIPDDGLHTRVPDLRHAQGIPWRGECSAPRSKPEMRRDTQHDGDLNPELQRAADHRAPRQDGDQARKRRAGAEPEERDDHRRAPDHGCRVGKQESMMAVQDAKAPRGHHQKAGAGKQDSDDGDGQLPFGAGKSRSDCTDEPWRRDDACEDDAADHQSQKRADPACDAIGFAPFPTREQRRVDRDEGCRERPFAEQVLQEVGDPETGRPRIGGVGGQPEVVSDDSLADEARKPAAQDTGGHQQRGTTGGARKLQPSVRVAGGLSQLLRLAPPGRACRSISSSSSS